MDLNDMEVVNMCRMLIDRFPVLAFPGHGSFSLRKRISYDRTEDISWTVLERPYKDWRRITGDSNRRHVWQSTDGVERMAEVVTTTQNFPE